MLPMRYRGLLNKAQIATPWALAAGLVALLIVLSALNAGLQANRCLLEIEAQLEGVSRVRIYWAKASHPFDEKRSEGLLVARTHPQQLAWLPSLKSIDRLRIDPLEYRGRMLIKRLELRQPGWEPIVLIPDAEGSIEPRHQIRTIERTAEGLRIATRGPDGQLEVRLKKKPGLRSWWRFLFADLQIQSLWLATGLALLIVAPGLALSFLLPAAGRSVDHLRLIAVFPLALLFFFTLYLLFEAVSALGGNGALAVASLAPVALLGIAWLAIRRWRRRSDAVSLIPITEGIAAYMLVVVLASFIVSARLPQPIDRMTFKNITGALTFNGFRAHDNMFQYVNGKAMADNLPFATFYEDKRLVYEVQDREILPGVLYATQRLLLKPLSPALADSYFVYTIFGTCLNAMVVLPLLVLLRRYFPRGRAGLALLLISLNASVFSNYYFTWFKLAGAALFLCALALLLDDDGPWQRWAGAGLLLGLATNMHAGNALGIPLFFLWLLWRYWRRGRRGRGALLSASLLCALFVAVNLPWAIVKRNYFPDSQILIKQHFLAGHSHPDGLLASAQEFIQAEPLPQQMRRRGLQLLTALRATEFATLARFLQQGEWQDFFYFWNKFEWEYPALTVGPLLLLLGVNALTRRRESELAEPAGQPEPAALTGDATPASRRLDNSTVLPRERRAAAVVALAALLAVIFAKSFNEPADFLHTLPMGPYLLLLLLLTGSALQMRPALRGLYAILMSVAAGRLLWGLII